jgi:Zn-dependent protease
MTAFPLIRIFDTEVRAHWTWIPLLAIITVIFGGGLTSTSPDAGLTAAVAWGSGVAIAVLVFLSVALHEIAHVYVARRMGVGGNVVVIQLLGGAYLMEIRARTSGEELRTSVAGPIATLALTLLIGVPAAYLWFGPIDLNSAPIAVQAAEFVAATVALFNAFVLVVNLIPGYPMDGARILHALAWMRSGSDEGATVTASRVGRWAGSAMMAAGVLFAFEINDPWAGIGLFVAGWLVIGSSRLLDRRTVLRGLVRGIHVGDAMDEDPARVPPQLTLDVFAGEYLGERLGSAALVERGTELLGLIGTSQIRRIPRKSWGNFHTEQVMVPISRVPETTSEADLWPVLEMLERSGLDAVLVASATGGHVLLTRRSAAHVIQERAQEAQRLLMATTKRRGWFRGR